MSENRRVVRTDRRPGCSQCSCNFRGGAHRCPVPGQRGIKADTERVSLMPNSPGVDFATAVALRRMATSIQATPAFVQGKHELLPRGCLSWTG